MSSHFARYLVAPRHSRHFNIFQSQKLNINFPPNRLHNSASFNSGGSMLIQTIFAGWCCSFFSNFLEKIWITAKKFHLGHSWEWEHFLSEFPFCTLLSCNYEFLMVRDCDEMIVEAVIFKIKIIQIFLLIKDFNPCSFNASFLLIKYS